ncbi:S-layer homology domain-containing protein [Paenibacillus sp. ACRSA]|uniref:S-layer homology domain-containing protein n=1 Tax=Paenibacillus sp. ACRSA TaxID=2918211 RepID=UPI001EF45E8A|nr:S-layer homology domain-containing protein [Paenibacillus sp. ACRSA]MCG7379546.1 S-layer homology domain-containing protein [Paenibacillus sp. ACRSA]
MRNTSNPIKENSNVMNTQGGEKKVMKKILSVALSTAMAFSMFASVAFGDTAVSPQQKFDALKAKGIFNGYPDGTAGLEKDMTRAEFAKVITKLLGLKEITGQLSYTDKNYTAKNWAVPYIEAVTAAGIMEGKNVEKKIFDFNGKVTVSEMATILTRALDLEIPAETNNSAPEWAKGYVQAAINAGFLDANANFAGNASRELLVGAAYVIDEAQNLKVSSYTVSEAGKVVEFKISDGETVKVTLDKALEANKETEVKFTYKDKEFTEKVTYVVTTATKVEKVSAANLKEVTVNFDGTVDEDTATDISNYSLKSGKAIESATLSEDKKTVTVELVGALNNNKVDFLNVSNIKAGNVVVSAKDVEFSISDNELPEVESVKSLGTKSVKVVFSEPVQLPAQSNFELDGKAYFGKITQPTLRTVVLTPYNTSALTVGDHKLTVVGVKDYAGFVSLTSSHDITVVEDKEAPTITAATATLESVTLTFSEEVDPETLDSGNVYWKSGTDKIKATGTPKALADNKYKFTFDKANALPTGAVLIYVEGVKDYSGNQIAKDTSVTVNAEIDQTRPEVRKAEALNARQIQVTFSKTLLLDSVKEFKNYTVTDKDGKVVAVKDANLSGKDNNVITIDLYTDLSTGDNTVTIKNIKDNTRLGNTMLDYSGKVNKADVTTPKLDSKLVNRASRTVIVGFDKKMDPATLADYSNYHVQLNGERVTLTPELADITVLNDSKAVSIKFVETYKNQTVAFRADDSTTQRNVQKLFVLGVKDTAGNLLKQFVDNSGLNVIDTTADITAGLADFDKDYPSYEAALTAQNTIQVKLSSSVSSAPKDAFTVTKAGAPVGIKEVVLDGTSVVKLVLDKDYGTDAGTLKVFVNIDRLGTLAGFSTSVGVKEAKVLDKVAPVVKPNVTGGFQNLTVVGETFDVVFSENITLDAAANNDLLTKDFEVVRYYDGKTLVPGVDFKVTTVGADFVTITLLDTASRTTTTKYTVNFTGSKYLTDVTNVKNQAAAFSGKETNGTVTGTAAPTLTTVNSSYASNNDGVIKGLDATKVYQYRNTDVTPVAWLPVTAGKTEIDGLAAGTYSVRVAASGTTPAGAVTTVTVAKATNTVADTALEAAKDAVAAYVALPVTTSNEITIAKASGVIATGKIAEAVTAGAPTADTNALTTQVTNKNTAIATAEATLADTAAINAAATALVTPTVAVDGSNLGTLPATGADGVAIAWSSEDTGVITNAGVYAGTGTATLTATLTKGTGTPATVTFEVTANATVITEITKN